MIIRDQIRLALESPMSGPNLDDFGHSFFDLSRMYTPEPIDLAEKR